jgi:regulatory protein
LLDEFETCNWLSDRRFANSYMADHRARDGALKLAHALRQRGIAETLITEALAALDDRGEDEITRARVVWTKKFGVEPASASERGRQMRFLQGRGFSVETIRVLMRKFQANDD